MRVCKGLLLLVLCLCCCSTALAEACQAEDGRVKYDAAVDFPQGGEVPLLNAVSLSLQREALISAFRLTETDAAGLECYDGGFALYSSQGQAVTDALYMIDHENLDGLTAFDLSFQPMEEACADAIDAFRQLGIDVCLEAAYAIDTREYDRLYQNHQEWIENQGRGKAEWPENDICYVIYLNQCHEGICFYPAYYPYDAMDHLCFGPEIMLLVFKDGVKFIACNGLVQTSLTGDDSCLPTAEQAINRFSEEYNYILSLEKKSVEIVRVSPVYLPFQGDSGLIFRPYWIFSGRMEDGAFWEYLYDPVSGEVFGL